MRDVRFYDMDFKRKGEFPRIISFNYEKCYCGFGSAEVHFPASETSVLTLLEENRFMFFETEGNVAIATGWQVGEDIAVFGRSPEWLLTKRGVPPLEKKAVATADVVRELIREFGGDIVELDETTTYEGVTDFLSEDVRSLYDIICAVLNPHKLGFEVVADMKNKKFVFRVITGTQRKVLISENNRTAYDMTYTADMSELATNSGWYERKFDDMGLWDAFRNNPTLRNGDENNFYRYYKISTGYSDRLGLNCVEGEYLVCDEENGNWKTSAEKPTSGWVYKDNPEVEGLKKWDAVLSGTKSGSQGSVEIEALKTEKTVSAQVRGMEYGVDYKLGDEVSVQIEFGAFKKSEKKRVSSVSLYYDVDKSGVVPVLSSLEE